MCTTSHATAAERGPVLGSAFDTLLPHHPLPLLLPLQVLRYGVGQKYGAHTDSLIDDSPRMATVGERWRGGAGRGGGGGIHVGWSSRSRRNVSPAVCVPVVRMAPVGLGAGAVAWRCWPGGGGGTGKAAHDEHGVGEAAEHSLRIRGVRCHDRRLGWCCQGPVLHDTAVRPAAARPLAFHC